MKMKNHKCYTCGQQFESAMKCETPADAERWMDAEVKHAVQFHGQTVTEAVEIIKSNLGYMAGYYDDAAAQKIKRLFSAVHPIFGMADYHKSFDSTAALAAGIEMAKKLGVTIK